MFSKRLVTQPEWSQAVAIALLETLAAMDVHHLALAVDVSDLQACGFADSKSQRIGRPEECLESECAAGVDDPGFRHGTVPQWIAG